MLGSKGQNNLESMGIQSTKVFLLSISYFSFIKIFVILENQKIIHYFCQLHSNSFSQDIFVEDKYQPNGRGGKQFRIHISVIHIIFYSIHMKNYH